MKNRKTLTEILQYRIRTAADAMTLACYGPSRSLAACPPHALRKANHALKDAMAALPRRPRPLFECGRVRLAVDRDGLHLGRIRARKPQPVSIVQAARLVATWQASADFRFSEV